MNGSSAAAPITSANLIQGLVSVAMTMVVAGLCLFASAGTFDWPAAWAYLFCFGAWMSLGTIWIVKYHPKLFVRRLEAGPSAEQSPLQKVAITLLFILTALFLVLPGIDHRFGWSHMSWQTSLVGLIVSITGLLLMMHVAVSNEFLSAKVTVETTQTVVQTGPYALVRHPFYSSVIIWIGFTPIALGSWWSLILIFPLVGGLFVRLRDEERQLATHLKGYSEYCTRVRARLIPFVI
jgi:protein-S-isoprenylcysteine O-methyltransferase Ste14